METIEDETCYGKDILRSIREVEECRRIDSPDCIFETTRIQIVKNSSRETGSINDDFGPLEATTKRVWGTGDKKDEYLGSCSKTWISSCVIFVRQKFGNLQFYNMRQMFPEIFKLFVVDKVICRDFIDTWLHFLIHKNRDFLKSFRVY